MPRPFPSTLTEDEEIIVRIILNKSQWIFENGGEYSTYAVVGRSFIAAYAHIPRHRLRTALASLLRSRIILSVCRRVYAIATVASAWPMPSADPVRINPERIVALWAKEFGRQVTYSVAFAQHIGGQRPDRQEYCFAISGITGPLSLREITLEPAPDWIFSLPKGVRLFGQALRHHDGRDIDTLRYYGQLFGMRCRLSMAAWLKQSLHLLPASLQIAALAAVAEIEDLSPRPPALRQAPPDFIPPPEDDPNTPFIASWRIIRFTPPESSNREVLTARVMRGHPRLGNDRLAWSSRLLWIDTKLGFARTLSRYYRLGKPAPD